MHLFKCKTYKSEDKRHRGIYYGPGSITLLKVVHMAGTKLLPCEWQRNRNCYVTYHVVVSGPHFS